MRKSLMSGKEDVAADCGFYGQTSKNKTACDSPWRGIYRRMGGQRHAGSGQTGNEISQFEISEGLSIKARLFHKLCHTKDTKQLSF